MRTHLLPIALAALLAACGSSTGPGSTLASLARHFDSLARTACPSASSGLPTQPSCPFVEGAVQGIAQGVLPSRIQVTTTTAGDAQWLGYLGLAQVPGRVPGTLDSIYRLVAYDGLDVSNGLLVYSPTQNIEATRALVGSTVWSSFPDRVVESNNVVVNSVGAPCAGIVGTAGGTPYPPQHCRLASFTVSLTVTFLPPAGIPGQSVTAVSANMAGFILDTAALDGVNFFRSHDATNSGKVR